MKGYTPLRDWACPSYDPRTGRAAPSSEGYKESVTIEGETIRPSAQIPDDPGVHGAPSFAERDKRCSRSGK